MTLCFKSWNVIFVVSAWLLDVLNNIWERHIIDFLVVWLFEQWYCCTRLLLYKLHSQDFLMSKDLHDLTDVVQTCILVFARICNYCPLSWLVFSSAFSVLWRARLISSLLLSSSDTVSSLGSTSSSLLDDETDLIGKGFWTGCAIRARFFPAVEFNASCDEVDEVVGNGVKSLGKMDLLVSASSLWSSFWLLLSHSVLAIVQW